MYPETLTQVPTELWCEIWHLLPMEDIVAVSQTCRRWRNMALGSPMLWCELDYVSSLHTWACGCGKCGVDEFSNFALFCDILPRSVALPVAVTISVLREPSNEEELDDLAELLRPNLHRLHALRIRSLDLDSAPAFLANFDALPALRLLTIGSDVDFRVENGIFHQGQKLDMPALETLEVRGEFLFHSDPPTSLSVPALSRLSIGLASMFEFLGYLEICPCLEYLQLRVAVRGFAYESAADILERVRAAVRRLPPCTTIDIIGMKAQQANEEHVILDIFDSPSSPASLALSYSTVAEPRDAQGFRIFTSIPRPTAVSLALDTRSDGEYFVASLKDDTLKRSVAFRVRPGSAPNVSFLWAHIPLCDIQRVELAIDARLWNPPALDPRLLRAASRLTLWFEAPEDVDRAVQPNPACPMQSLEELKICVAQRATAQPSSLERLRESWITRRRLALVDETSTASSRIRFPAGYLRRLVRSFNLPRQLESIAVDREVNFEGDMASELAELARVIMTV